MSVMHRVAQRLSRPSDTDAPLLDEQPIREQLAAAVTRLKQQNFSHSEQRQSGLAASRFRGRGMDFEDSRAYQPGDELRQIDWRLTARSGHWQSKVFAEERRPEIVVLMDRSASLRFGTRQQLKVTQALRASIVALALAQVQNANIRVLTTDAPALPGSRSTTESHLLALLTRLAQPAPPQAFNTDETAFPRLLEQLQEENLQGDHVFLISDFMALGEPHRPLLGRLAETARVHAVHILDPAECQLPDAGALSIEDMATQQGFQLDSHDPHTRQRFEKLAAEHHRSKEKLLRGHGIHYQRLLTTDDALEVMSA